MPVFEVAISKRVFLNLQVEATTAEEAQAAIEKQHAEGSLTTDGWEHFKVGEEAEEFVVDWSEPDDPDDSTRPASTMGM
jgi:hypothetical protein